MSSALKSAMETGKNAVESGAHTLSDLVDEARSRIEDLPPLANARKKRRRKKSSLFALIALALFAMVVAKQFRPHAADHAHGPDHGSEKQAADRVK